eukprot:1049743-Amphidinium_carterae.1
MDIGAIKGKGKNKGNGKDKGNSKGKEKKGTDTCSGCGSTSHSRQDCPHKTTVCNKCGKTGHLARVCWSGEKGKGSGSTQQAAQKGGKGGSGKSTGKIQCRNCGGWGHYAKQ